jgi:large subunit ribosomal protein L21e
MLRQKRVRERGKHKTSSLIKEFKEGDDVVIYRNLSFKGLPPKQFQGKPGKIMGKSGKAYIVRFLNGKVYKDLTLNPVHVKRRNIDNR